MVKKKSRVSDGKAAETPLQLERVLGLSTINNAAFASSATGDVFYAAGCVVRLVLSLLSSRSANNYICN